MKHIAIIGECMIELNGSPFGNMQQAYGGDTLNTAIYLNRAQRAFASDESAKVSYVTAVGTDSISQGMVEAWKKEGINTEYVLTCENKTPGLYLIQLDEQGERTFMYWRNDSAARWLIQHPNFESIASQLVDVDMVYISGITLAILPEQDRHKLLCLLKELKVKGVELCFDSNFRPALWPNDQNQSVMSAYNAMYSITDTAIVTYEDEQALWGDKNSEETMMRLKDQGIKNVVVKLGSEGCLLSQNGKKTQSIATTPVKNVVDTTSAGDSFNGAFLAAYLNGSKLEQACKMGNKLASIVIQYRGAIIDPKHTQLALI